MDVCVFDLETCAVEELHRRPDFIRLAGFTMPDGSVRITTDFARLVARLEAADAIAGHHIIGFDLLALAKWHGADYEALARKAFDTLIVEHHLDPVAAKGVQRNGYYKLDAVCARYGVAGKTDDIKALARRWGGFDMIPLDDRDYQDYLIGDVIASRELLRVQRAKVDRLPAGDRAYIRREHATEATMGRVTLEGFRVDTDLTMQRHAAGQSRLEAGRQKMHAEYGMPLEGRYPHRTNVGKAAFRRALLDTGIREDALDANWPTGKDGSLLTGKEVLTPMAELFDKSNPAAADICRTILAMNGERTVYGTILDHVVDGRVHPYIGPDQASGRWSMKNPGLTVLGKRGGKSVERACLVSDEDELLVAIDADQVDARVVAAECQDPAYMELFQPGRDLHSEVAWLVWPSPVDHSSVCTTEPAPRCKCVRRDQSKVNSHGFSYGLGANGMARQNNLPLEICVRFIEGFTQAFPRLAEWKAEMRTLAGALPYGEQAPEGDTYRILRTWAGRPVRVERERAYTQATALVGQGGTRDVMAHAALSLAPDVRRRIRAVIHDEFVFSLPRDRAAEMGQQIAADMAFDLRGVRITFGVSQPGENWSLCY